MTAMERVAAFGSRSTISGWAAISPSRKSSRFAHHRVHRRPDYPASLGLDRRQGGEGAARWWTASRIPAAGGVSPIGRISGRHRQYRCRERPDLSEAHRVDVRQHIGQIVGRQKRRRSPTASSAPQIHRATNANGPSRISRARNSALVGSGRGLTKRLIGSSPCACAPHRGSSPLPPSSGRPDEVGGTGSMARVLVMPALEARQIGLTRQRPHPGIPFALASPSLGPRPRSRSRRIGRSDRRPPRRHTTERAEPDRHIVRLDRSTCR